MLIWSRWGILVFVCLGLGVGTGALLNLVLDPGVTGSPGFGLFIGVGLGTAGICTYLLNRHVIARHLDKPRPQVVLQPLAQPFVHPDGMKQTHQQVAVLDPPTGQPLYVRPTFSPRPPGSSPSCPCSSSARACRRPSPRRSARPT